MSLSLSVKAEDIFPNASARCQSLTQYDMIVKWRAPHLGEFRLVGNGPGLPRYTYSKTDQIDWVINGPGSWSDMHIDEWSKVVIGYEDVIDPDTGEVVKKPIYKMKWRMIAAVFPAAVACGTDPATGNPYEPDSNAGNQEWQQPPHVWENGQIPGNIAYPIFVNTGGVTIYNAQGNLLLSLDYGSMQDFEEPVSYALRAETADGLIHLYQQNNGWWNIVIGPMDSYGKYQSYQFYGVPYETWCGWEWFDTDPEGTWSQFQECVPVPDYE